MYPRLDSSQDSNYELQEGQEQTITPLHGQHKEEKQEVKEVSLKEYVDIQDNKVVAFVINWIKSTFVKDLMGYLNNEFKQSILKEIRK